MVTFKKNQKGFTILELIIASTVFGVMLLLASAGIIQIGKIYYKGIVVNRTQEAVRVVVDDISRNYQTKPTGANPYSTSDSFGGGNGGPGSPRAVCIGQTRYTYQTGMVVKPGTFALWTDQIKLGADCTAPNLNGVPANMVPGDDNSESESDYAKAYRKEMLANNMRLSQFSLPMPVNNMQEVYVRIVYAPEEDVLKNATPGSEECISTETGGQFCAIATLGSFVKARQK